MSLSQYEAWFVTGSQHLYGPETLDQVAQHAQAVARQLNDEAAIPVKVVFKPVLTNPRDILQLCLEANAHPTCLGLIAWMHTFSPAKMWIAGLKALQKPLLHLHTQFNRDVPWSEIDMDFMNLNQSAHGGREFGFINTRLGKGRKVVVGHWENEAVQARVATWCRAAAGAAESKKLKVARLGDNMRQVAVTEGNKVSAQIQFGYEVNGYGLGDLTAHLHEVDQSAVAKLMATYEEAYHLADELKANGAMRSSLEEAARIELALRSFLLEGGFMAFTDTFENLEGLRQLPGLPVQRLMAEGYGFGAEGDWKTAALTRIMKVMAEGLPGGNSFMEDYTYHFAPGQQQVLGAHMLEICPSIAQGKATCEVHPLGIGGKEDPVRLVFDAAPGAALNASMIDLGNRFRLLVNPVLGVEPAHPLPNLPVARVLWEPEPNLPDAAAAWILAGGAHHTVYSQNLTVAHLEDYADMVDVEMVLVDQQTQLYRFKQELRWSELYYRLR
ncbi:MAG: L-arabinose isomerase [Bacteroidota bacterium]